ncbi:Mitotic apparatus protein [Histomonas meleagridis]|uniref:Mitotic apparatus protein n=1 Tax=Histomonas meleagridis TaxID=135588 RepID=UPI00355A5418|nr:Mitotic apparatus protein [Histomonas meleagridis]KAH0796890.1 Mitotic apparatus protein [Histomonas meleagridis]
MSKPQFSVEEDHDFKPKEKVLIIDKNGHDLWEGEIVSIEDGKYKIHYPEYPEDDETLEGTSRILVNNRSNRYIFNTQEASRNTILPKEIEDEEEEAEESENDEEDDYKPQKSQDEKKSKKKKSKGKSKKSKKPVARPRPEGCRVSPRRQN